MFEPSLEDNKLSEDVLNAAFHVHTVLGPGLLEKVYQESLYFVLNKRGLKVEKEKFLPVDFEGHKIDGGFRLDLLVEDRLIIEIKAVEKIIPIHEAQLQTYLRLSKKHYGLILNFNTLKLKDGIKRIVMTK